MQTYKYRIADLNVLITFIHSKIDGTLLLESLEPFRVEELDGELLFELLVDDSYKVIPKEHCERIKVFDTGNGDTVVDLLDDGGYQFIIKDTNKASCALLQTNKDFSKCRCALNGNFSMRNFGLNNVLMLVYAFAAARRNTVLIHASVVRKGGYGYPFIAKSGTGKSTQVSMWLRHIPGCDLMNDDNPIVRFVDGECWIYGSPWSGKTPCYRNVRAKLGAVTRINRSEKNYVEQQPPIKAFASLLPSCSSMKWDKEVYDLICNTVTRIVEHVDIYTLHCQPNAEAAQVCYKGIAAKNETNVEITA
ncbi:MAG: hypothetical protein MSG77_00830 [Prevotella sp.]|nr:hypothetical protein [Prevotella sp.]